MRRDVQGALFERALDQFGLVTAQDAHDLGIEAVYLRQMARRGTLERVSRGVYRFPAAPSSRLDQYAQASLWPIGVRGVMSHETALDLHDLCDVNPGAITFTVPSAHRIRRREVPALYGIHHRDLDQGDMTTVEGVPVVTPVKAVLDAIEGAVRQDLVEQAITTLRDRRDLDRAGEARIYGLLYGGSR